MIELPDYARTATQDSEELLDFLKNDVEPLRPSICLEIGVFAGGGASAWLHFAADDALLIGVDDLTQQVWPKVITRPGQEFKFVRGDSTDIDTLAVVLTVLNGRKVDFLFVDGDHSEAVCRSDMEMYVPLVRPGGLVGMHDVIGNTDVNRVWLDYALRYHKGAKFYFNEHAAHRMGIGCFRILG